MDSAVSAARWVVGKALGPVTDGLVEAWAASRELGPNVDALKMELLYAQGVLDNAQGKDIRSPALKELLQKLRDLAFDADDVLDELDYFRIQDELDGTYHAADEHAKGSVPNLFLNVTHTAIAASKRLGFSKCSCAAAAAADNGDPIPTCPRSEQGAQGRGLCCGWSHNDHDSEEEEEEATGGGIRKLACGARNTIHAVGKRLSCSSFPAVDDDDDDSSVSICCGACMHKPPQQRKDVIKETPKLKIDRVGLSIRMKDVVDQLQLVCAKVTTILNLEIHHSIRSTDSSTASNRPITTPTSIEPKLYGRDDTTKSIIDYITQGTDCGKDLTVLPIVGPGGIGKTTLIQYIYNSLEVQNHFQVKVWICVSQNFSVDKLIEEIKQYVPKVDGEKDGRPEELIEQRLKSKRFLLILDDIWKCQSDDWKKLLLPLTKGQTKGNIILVTTRFPVVAEMVKTMDNSVDLEGLDPGAFRDLFLAYVFGDKLPRDVHKDLLVIGDKIAGKLKGSPLAAKTVGRLLRNHFDQYHWNRVLESREWEMETSNHDIMPALQLSYDYLPFHLQQCFFYCALFPEDYKFDTKELTCFWIGLDILHSEYQNKTNDDIALNNLNDLVSHGFFKKDETDGHPCYIIHDLLHNLAVKVASRECVSLHYSNVRSVEIWPSIRHLSINTDGVDDSDGMNNESFRNILQKLKTRVKVENLQTVMIFGELDESFAESFHDLFKEASALRVLHLPKMSFPVGFIFNKFSTLVHLRYIRLGAPRRSKTHLTSALSRFYHLRILDLEAWDGCLDLPRDFSNLSKLCHFLTKHDKLHFAICDVGKLQFLQELERFEVNKEEKSFELKQLGHLMELRRLGIYNLERIDTKEAAAEAKLFDKNHLLKLALSWDKCQASRYPDKEDQVLENLRPCNNLKELFIIEHGGSTCPSWLGAELSVKSLETLHLSNVTWKNLPPIGEVCLVNGLGEDQFVSCNTGQSFQNLKRLELVGLPNLRKWTAKEVPMFSLIEVLIVKNCNEVIELPFSYCTYCPSEGYENLFPRLREVEIENCPQLRMPPMPYTQTLCFVHINDVGTRLKKLHYESTLYTLRIVGKTDLNGLDDKILAFYNLTQLQELKVHNCKHLAASHLQMLTSLKRLVLIDSCVVFHPSESRSEDEWQLPVEYLRIWNWSVDGKALRKLLSRLPKLSELYLWDCNKITRMCIAVEQQQTTAVELEDTQAVESIQQQQVAEDLVEEEGVVPQLAMDQEDDDGMLIFSAHLSNSLQRLFLSRCPELILDVARPVLPTSHEEGTGGWGLQSLHSLQILHIWHCPKFLSTYNAPGCPFPSSLQCLKIVGCMEGVQTLDFISNLNFLTELHIEDCGEDLRCEGLWPLLTQGQLSELGVFATPRFFAGLDPILGGLQDGQEQQLSPLQCSSKLQELRTDDFAGVLVKPICLLLSSSLTELRLGLNGEVERFMKEQEEALQLLTSLRDLQFWRCSKLQCLPVGLHRLTSLKRLCIENCPSIRSLPKGGLPSSLQELDVRYRNNEKLKQRTPQSIHALFPNMWISCDILYLYIDLMWQKHIFGNQQCGSYVLEGITPIVSSRMNICLEYSCGLPKGVIGSDSIAFCHSQQHEDVTVSWSWMQLYPFQDNAQQA
uniref:AAA+ ATPase domain-containing protein n=1 Tax=Oryza glumipatula TaxID=40148 RepID=A0A0D9ZR05_9ORYZ